MIFICYSKCSTCKKAEKYLKDKKIRFQIRDIKEDNPSYEELQHWINKYHLDIKKLFNTSGIKYRELSLKDRLNNMSDDDKIKILASDGMLVKRPLLIMDDRILIGFKEKEWDEI